MPFGFPDISSGGGAIPITGGAATSGDVAGSVDVRFAPVNVAGLFGSTAQSSSQFLVPALILGGALLAYTLFRRKR